MPDYVNPKTGVTVNVPEELAETLGYLVPAKSAAKSDADKAEDDKPAAPKRRAR